MGQRQKKAHVDLSQKLPQNYRLNTCASATFETDLTSCPQPPPTTGAQLGYARVSTGHQSLDQQLDALTAAGVDPDRIYRDKLSGTSTREQRPGLAALLDYARRRRRNRRGRNRPVGPQRRRSDDDDSRATRPRDRAAVAARRASTLRMRRAEWLRECLPAWQSLSWSWAVNAVQRHGRRVGHAGSTSDVPRRSMRIESRSGAAHAR